LLFSGVHALPSAERGAYLCAGVMQMEVHTRRRFAAREEDVAGWHVVHVTGDVGAHSAGILPTLVLYAMRRGAEQVCLDLTAIERVDRSGAQALTRCSRAARYAGGRLAMIAPDDPEVAEALEDSGAARDVPRIDGRDELTTPRTRRTQARPTRPRRPSRAR
jgi:anti-anti-sigma regulatory factor